jgi:hypothetical protein
VLGMISHPKSGIVGPVIVVDFKPIFPSLYAGLPSNAFDDNRDAEVTATFGYSVVGELAEQLVHMRAGSMFLPKCRL